MEVSYFSNPRWKKEHNYCCAVTIQKVKHTSCTNFLYPNLCRCEDTGSKEDFSKTVISICRTFCPEELEILQRAAAPQADLKPKKEPKPETETRTQFKVCANHWPQHGLNSSSELTLP